MTKGGRIMRKILLDFNPDRTVEGIHQYLRFEMEFPSYYGNNLDALYDELTSITEETCVGVFGLFKEKGEASAYQRKIWKVMRDAERETPYLRVIFGDMKENYEEE